MSPRFDESDIDRLHEAVNITEIISGYVTLKRGAKGDWWGRCPFHNEKTASFHVIPDRGMFYCFGCGKGGNAITFLMDMDGISFTEAITNLSDRTGFQLNAIAGGESPRKSSDRDAIFRANKLASAHFHNNLTTKNKSTSAKKAFNYLIDRGINEDIIKKYQLGFAEPSWDNLVSEFPKWRLNTEIAQKSGIASRKKSGSGYIDRFRGRIIFPIYNLSGNPVAFGGRILEGVTPEGENAKYINSPETPVYSKGNILYGLNVARNCIRTEKSAFLVEGYTDLLALARAGIENVTASLGTAFTQAQARLLKRFTSKVVVCYDSDNAGKTASVRAAEILTREGVEARLVLFPDGEDPDSMLVSNGEDELLRILNSDLSFVQFVLKTSSDGEPEVSPKDWSSSVKTKVTHQLLQTIINVHEPVQREMLLEELSSELGLPRTVLDKTRLNITPEKVYNEQGIQKDKLQVPKDSIAERDLIAALLSDLSLIKEVAEEIELSTFRYEPLKIIYSELEKAYLKGKSIKPESIIESFEDPAIRAFITQSVMRSYDTETVIIRKEIRGSIIALKMRDYNDRKSELEGEIAEANRNGKSSREFMKQLIELQKEMREQN